MPRPRSFDCDEVLERAMHLFWERGFDATSIGDLEAQMRISRVSIYRTFGDKVGLYHAALDRYLARVAEDMRAALAANGGGMPGIEAFFDAMMGRCAGERSKAGCFAVNAAVEMSGRCARTAENFRVHFRGATATFRDTLAQARDAGEIDPSLELDGCARMLVALVHGVMVVARMADDPSEVGPAVDQALALIRTWRAPSI